MEPSLHGYLEISLQQGFACLLRAPLSSSICEQTHEPPPEIPSPLSLLLLLTASHFLKIWRQMPIKHLGSIHVLCLILNEHVETHPCHT